MPKYFSSLNWNVLMADGEDINSIDNAITRAKQGLLPTIIIVNTTIGKHSKYEELIIFMELNYQKKILRK